MEWTVDGGRWTVGSQNLGKCLIDREPLVVPILLPYCPVLMWVFCVGVSAGQMIYVEWVLHE